MKYLLMILTILAGSNRTKETPYATVRREYAMIKGMKEVYFSKDGVRWNKQDDLSEVIRGIYAKENKIMSDSTEDKWNYMFTCKLIITE